MILPQHLFLSSDGSLYDTRRDNWSAAPLRADYSRHHTRIANTMQLRATLRAGAYAWPGGYRLFLVADDSSPMCFDCVRAEYYQCAYSIRHRISDGWRVVGCMTNDEDDDMQCAHCNRRIPSNYGSDEE